MKRVIGISFTSNVFKIEANATGKKDGFLVLKKSLHVVQYDESLRDYTVY